jgi:signal transduction histidine kinase
VAWRTLLDGVGPLFPFRLDGPIPDGTTSVDPAQMTQVLVNLLKNAHEAGGPPGEVSVVVRERAGGEAAILILDRGTGMTDEEMRTALLPFVTGKPGGTGLGLPLAVEIVAAHGGTLRIARREGGGTAVTFTVPPARG